MEPTTQKIVPVSAGMPERERQNGAVRPTPGTRTGLVWDYADAILAKRIAAGEQHPVPTIAEVRALYEGNVEGARLATCQAQFDRWLKFHNARAALKARREAEKTDTTAAKEAAKAEKAQKKAEREAAKSAKEAAKAERAAKAGEREAEKAAKAEAREKAKAEKEAERKAKAEAKEAEKAEKARIAAENAEKARIAAAAAVAAVNAPSPEAAVAAVAADAPKGRNRNKTTEAPASE